jgi:hypothetical protein
MPYLDTKARHAIVRTTNDWFSVALKEIFIKELKKHFGRLQDGGYLDEEHQDKKLPAFMILWA